MSFCDVRHSYIYFDIDTTLFHNSIESILQSRQLQCGGRSYSTFEMQSCDAQNISITSSTFFSNSLCFARFSTVTATIFARTSSYSLLNRKSFSLHCSARKIFLTIKILSNQSISIQSLCEYYIFMFPDLSLTPVPLVIRLLLLINYY